VRLPVAVSLATEKQWRSSGLMALMEHWLVAHEILRGDLPYLKRAMIVRYETLISEPGATLATIYRFLGLEPHSTTFKATSEHNQKYFEQWRALARDPETRETIREGIDKYETRVRAFEYSLQDLSLFLN
jgi:Sulfotransferase domain